MNYIEKIKQAGEAYRAGSLESGCTALLVQLAGESEQWAELIAQDLEAKEMNIQALAKTMTEYARKHRVRNEFCMDDATARNIITDFYKLPEKDAVATATETKSEAGWESVDLLDLL